MYIVFLYANMYMYIVCFVSTACGEPPLCMSCSALFAIKHAIEAFRKDIGKDTYFALGKTNLFWYPCLFACI